MRILVTGGAGFIGSHIAERYLSEGHQVSIVDNLSSGKAENIPSGATFYPLDILDPALEEVFSRERPRVVSHHAAQIDVRRSVSDPLLDAQVNIIGTLSLLKYAVGYGVAQVIFASSGGTIYGEGNKLPLAEDSCSRPKSPYGLSKLTGEMYLGLYWELFGLNSVALRYSNVYGPRQDPHGEAGVVAIFCQEIVRGRPLTIFGDGTQTRDYIYVSDVVEANVRVLEMEGHHIFNIGTQKETSVNDLVSAFETMLHAPLPRLHKGPRPGEIQRNCLDIGKARSQLGWSPLIDLGEGLRETLRWVESAPIAERKSR
jgi:UDP-glucose 4-epimerase